MEYAKYYTKLELPNMRVTRNVEESTKIIFPDQIPNAEQTSSSSIDSTSASTTKSEFLESNFKQSVKWIITNFSSIVFGVPY